jgi:PAS domain S-box-containing protein
MSHAMYTILIVDDNPNNLFTLRTLLTANLDTEVIEAESGVTALEKVSQQKIDLILLDIQMPELDGFETAKLIRSRKKYQDIPIIFLTAVYKSDEFREKGLAGGAIDYLTKPIDETMLVNRVKAYLRLLEAERAINLQLQAEIEERKRMERTLAEERNLLRTLIDNLPDLIYVKDAESRFLTANKAVVASLGLTKQEDLLGKTDFDFHPVEMAKQYFADERKIFESGQPLVSQEETIFDQRTNNTTWLLTTKIPLQDERGNITELVGINRDITELKRAEEELKRLNQQLQEASQHKSDFLSSMSHELRTPLNATIGYVSLTLNTLKNTLSSEQLENLVKAERSARTLLQLINDVLDFSKIEAGMMDILIEEINLTDIVEDVAITAEGLLLDKPVEMKSDIASNLPAVESDYTKIKQMLNNLVGNAIKFTSEGYVAIRAMPINKGSVVRIEIEDTGGGIPKEKLEMVFESFKQVDSSIKKKFGGTGLGLAITKKFCEMLGIEIGVESEVEKGTMFWLQIPIRFDVTLERKTPPSPPQGGTSQEGKTPPYPPQGGTSQEGKTPPYPPQGGIVQEGMGDYQTVLVVDDDNMNLLLMKSVFRTTGCTVYTARSGQEAIDIAKEKLPDLIMMDLSMPGIDGIEATQQLRQYPATAKTVVIACTALAIEDAQEQALQAGCDGFIRRPIEPDRLLEKVAKIVSDTKTRKHENI